MKLIPCVPFNLLCAQLVLLAIFETLNSPRTSKETSEASADTCDTSLNTSLNTWQCQVALGGQLTASIQSAFTNCNFQNIVCRPSDGMDFASIRDISSNLIHAACVYNFMLIFRLVSLHFLSLSISHSLAFCPYLSLSPS